MDDTNPLWSITILTIPNREEYLKRLVESINELELRNPVELVIVYNHEVKENLFAIEETIRGYSKKIPTYVYFNHQNPTIVGGRNFQLSICKAPLICFVDDDITMHGNIFPALEDTLAKNPLGIVGVRSYVEGTDELFKPRESTPYTEIKNIRYMPVQGMLIAGYRQLFIDIGGFNMRREFWGEWTELNLRLWRNGFTSGYCMDCGFLRHWHKAPESPTRNMTGKEKHVIWGLICTALEYDAVDINEATEVFWSLVEERYIAYSFGDALSYKNLLKTVLELMPKLSSEWGNITKFKEDIVRRHKFDFKPFQRFTEPAIRKLLKSAEKDIVKYRKQVFAKKESILMKALRMIFKKRKSSKE